MIAAAEVLAGIAFTPAKREMMAKSIGQQVERFKHRQTIPLAENGLAPALTFDPRPPGMTLVGRLYDEGTLVRVENVLEKELGVWEKRPAV